MKPASMISKKIQLPEILLFAGVFAAILWAVYFSLVTISMPYQIELREGATQVMTEILLKGGNPFVYDNQPLAMNNYGIGYNLAVLPFAALFGNTLIAHRVVTFLFIVLSGSLGFLAVHKKSKSTSLALACAAFIMIGLIGRGSIGAFPSAMGVFLFLFAVLIPFFRSFDFTSLLVSVLISLFAFYTKAYFVLGFGVVASYLFLFVSKRKGIIYSLTFAFVFLLSLQAVRIIFPLYFVNTLIGNVSNTSLSSSHLLAQLKDLFFIFYPVLILFAIHLLWNIFEKKISFSKQVSLFTWDSPFFSASLNYFGYLFFCSLLAFLFILGRHIGSYLNYAYQLLIPTFFIWFQQEIAVREKLKLILVPVLLFNLFTWGQSLLSPAMLNQKDSKEWAQVYEYLHASSVILNSPTTVTEVMALGQMPMDSGQTAYYYAVEPFSENLLTGTTYDEFYNDGFRYVLLIDRMIEKQRFDLVITTKEKANFYHDKMLWDYYSPVDEIKVEMPQTGQVWTLVFWKPLVK